MKNKLRLLTAMAAMLTFTQNSFGQTPGMAINTSGAPAASCAMLDVASGSQGVLVPRMSATSMTGISSPVAGLLVYNTTAGGFYYWSGSAWTAVGGGSGTVSSVTAGTGLSGGTITSTGTISLPAVGAAGTYGSATLVPVITTDAEGRVTGVTTSSISSGSGTVTSVTDNAGLAPLFTSATATGATTPVITYSLTGAAAYSVLTNSTSATAAPVYGKVAPQALYSISGAATANFFYQGNGTWQQITNASVSNTAGIAYSKLNLGSSVQPTIDLAYTGTPSTTTFLRGDESWAAPFALTTTGSGAATFTGGTLNIPTGGGSGTVTSVSAGNLSPLFTSSTATSTTTPAISYSLSTAPAYSVLTNSTNATATPAYGAVMPQVLYATAGTPSSSTFYRGDGQWATPAGGGGGTGTTFPVSSPVTASRTLLSTDQFIYWTSGNLYTITLSNTGMTAGQVFYFSNMGINYGANSGGLTISVPSGYTLYVPGFAIIGTIATTYTGPATYPGISVCTMVYLGSNNFLCLNVQ